MVDEHVGDAPKQIACPVPDVTIIIPTRNEAENISELISRLDAALKGTYAEVLFVDDSTDDTSDRVREVAATSPWPVHLLHRPPGERVGGLGGAVVAGLRLTRTEWAVVMDADLQHPPEVVPALLDAASAGSVDVVVASRYCGDGSAGGLSSRYRARVSNSAMSLARMAFPRPLATCSDPMSGFFAVRRSALDLDRLRPIGFKILLEILVRTRGLRVAERPFTFAQRHSGESKTSLAEGIRFGRQLLRLRIATTPRPRPRTHRSRHRRPRRLPAVALFAALSRMLGFGAVGVSGIAVNTFVLWALVSQAGVHYLLSAALATQVSTAWNFALTDALVFRGPKRGNWRRRLVPFAVMNNLTLVLRLPALALLVDRAHLDYVISNVSVLLLLFLVRFVVTDRFIYRWGGSMTATSNGDESGRHPYVDIVVDLSETPSRHGTPVCDASDQKLPMPPTPRYLPHRYDIHGLVRVGSEVPLRELEYFRSPQLQADYDIEVRRGRVGTGRPRRRTLVTQTVSPLGVRYEEHLGALGANVEVHMGAPIEVTIGPLLARSPHVLYANVVEALLRFVLVTRGHMLLHAACLELGGTGVMLSARTDTGKTGTVLRLLREGDVRFLSDDMTLIASDGTALCYPKPLTISRHTLRAVDVDELTRREWRQLRLQSRLHSKEGRAVGTRLGEMNLPIMAMNAVTQWLVPPPKYAVDRLVPCLLTQRVRAEELFVIERGPATVDGIKPVDLVDLLIENTDDAYGFPPFRYLAPALVVGGDSYEQLRAAERTILEAAVSEVRARRLVRDDFGWADEIPKLLTVPRTDRDADRDVEPVAGASTSPRPARHGVEPAAPAVPQTVDRR